jgi:exopolysaccharide biosynthesis polyprenyl glycosylphosphotransferase
MGSVGYAKDIDRDSRGARAIAQPSDRHAISRSLRRALTATALVDLAILSFCVLLAWNVRWVHDFWDFSTRTPELVNLQAAPVIVALWMAVLALQGSYAPRSFAEGSEEYRRVAFGSFLTGCLVGLGCFLLHLPLSRGFVIMTFFAGVPLLLLGRFMVRQSVYSLRRSGRLLHRVVAVGGPSGISEVVDALRRDQYVGYSVVGACVPDEIALEPERMPVPVLGRVRDLREMCDLVDADTVLVARGGYSSARELRRVAWELEGSNIDLIVVPSVTDVAGSRIRMRPVAGLPLLHVEQPQAGNAGGVPKRLFDIVFASLALLLLSPLFLVVAAVVKLQDGGPVFFRQERVGRAGEPFGMLKFRSMVMDAEARLADLVALNESDGVLFKIKADPRTTPAGRFLRRYSVDELPQLVNVLRGEMSLVGPRPPLPSEVERYVDDVHRRLLVRPGLTGLWQVSGRSGLSWDESVRLDLYYVDNWSMTTDLVIIAKTVGAVVGKTGAY